jgi:hypothetical protein
MNSRKKIRAIRNMVADAQRRIATAKAPAERPSELLATALSSIDELLLELEFPAVEHSRAPFLRAPKKRLPN